MNIILHISDIHVGVRQKPKSQDKIVAALRSINCEISTLVIVVTGDVTNSGQAQQYKDASEYLLYLRKQLIDEFKTDVYLVICPGNHDCSFPVDTAVRDLVINEVRLRGILPDSNAMIEQCTSVQVPFFQWLVNIKGAPDNIVPCLAWISEINCKDGTKIAFRVLNTAWMSTIREVQGSLFFPVSQIPDTPNVDLRVTLLHHPYPWFQSGNGRELRRRLEESSDLVLSGHEHDYDEYTTTRKLYETTGYIEGGVFANDEENSCFFNIIQVDSRNALFAVTPFSWCKDMFVADIAEPRWRQYICISSDIVPQQKLSKEMHQFLENTGLELTHRAKALNLEDVFVPPDLRTYEGCDTPTERITTIIPSQKMMDKLFEDKYAYLLGEGQCGKTSLIKMMFLKAIRCGLYPVYVSGTDLRKADDHQLKKMIEDSVRKQYMRLSIEEFWQLSVEKRVAFIDDFGDSLLNASGKIEVVGWFKRKFGRVYLFGGDLTQVEELVANSDKDTGLQGFNRYEISPFGHYLRDVLIEKWITLGQKDCLEHSDLQYELRQIADTISRALGDNLLPANPIYILIFLQQLEAQVPIDTRSGSFGYFYETVLTSALQKSSRSAEDVDAKYTYLSELAWHMRCQGESEIEEEELDYFTRMHLERFRLDKNALQLRNEVVDSRLLQTHYGKYRFVYRYFFYYFIARYMRDNFEDADVQSCIIEAAHDIHREDFANILIFLTYLTKSKLVIRRVLDQAKVLFKGIEPCNLTEHVAFMRRMQESVPRIILLDGDPQIQRREMLKKRDALELNKTADQETKNKEDVQGDEELNLLLSVNRAIKTLQVLGQILRNFIGSLKKDTKLEIIQECFDLALRVLNGFYISLERHLNSTLVALAELFGKNFKDLPTHKRAIAARKFLFFVTEIMCIATLRRISNAVGSEKLILSYEDLESAYNTRATRFVQLSMRLDHFRRFPEKRILDIMKEVKDDSFSLTLLRILVAEHFYFFERPYTTRQSICQKLGISYQKTVGPIKARQSGRQKKK